MDERTVRRNGSAVMPDRQLARSKHKNSEMEQEQTGYNFARLASAPILSFLLQLTCKLPYLFFPRDIHNAFGIVVEAFA